MGLHLSCAISEQAKSKSVISPVDPVPRWLESANRCRIIIASSSKIFYHHANSNINTHSKDAAPTQFHGTTSHAWPLVAALDSALRASRRGYVALATIITYKARTTCKAQQFLSQTALHSSACFSTFQPKSQSISDAIKQIFGLAQQPPSKANQPAPRPKFRTTIEKSSRNLVRESTLGRKSIQLVRYNTEDLHSVRDGSRFILSPSLFSWLGRYDLERDREALRRERWLDFSPCSVSEPKRPFITNNQLLRLEIHPMKSYLEFVTVPTADTPGTTLLLHYDSRRYMIGRVGEGTQRGWVERGISMRKIEHIFLTGKTSSENVGGLLGMVLTLADILKEAKDAISSKAKNQQEYANGMGAAGSNNIQQNRALHIYGTSNLLHAVATARRFIFRKGMALNVKELKDLSYPDNNGEWKPTYEDENIRVWSMVIKPDTALNIESPTFNTRKRTFDQLNEVEPMMNLNEGEAMPQSEAEREARYDTLRQAVVHDMFGSKWNLDCLVETPLNEVQLPAKIWIRDSSTRGIQEYTGPLPGGAEPLPDPNLKVLVRSPWPGALVSVLPPTTPKDDAVSYIIHPQPRRGKFVVEKANALDVPKGSLRGKLASGESITLDNGKVVTPDMVLGDEQRGNGIAIVDLPSDDYVGPLIEREEWRNEELTNHLSAIIWILGRDVINNDQLRKFIETHSNLKHIISSPDVCPNELAFESSATSAVRLAQMDTENFPIPHFDNVTVPQTSYRPRKGKLISMPPSILSAKRGLKFHVEPQFTVQTDKIHTQLDTLGLLADSDEEHVSLARSALSSLNEGKEASELQRWKDSLPKPGADVEIVTLGTGSALPSKYRNVSATLVRVPGYGNYILDCGENTLGQLQRVFDPDELRNILKDLKLIWISHLHADHHLGTVSLINAWYSVVHGKDSTVPPISPDFEKDLLNSTLTKHLSQEGASPKLPYLAVLSQNTWLQYLAEFSDIEDFGYSHILPLTVIPADPYSTDPNKLTTKLKLTHKKCHGTVMDPRLVPTYLGLQDIQSVYVDHCRGAQAVTLTFPVQPDGKEPFKLSYSGDCRPSKRFSVIGRNSTVLIHEATFDDELQKEAMAKKHSTTSEALRVGAEMRAKSVVLTHFSQRYQKIPILDVKNFGTGLEGMEDVVNEANTRVNAGVDMEDEIQDVPEPEIESEPEMKAGAQIVNLVDGLDQEKNIQIAEDEPAPIENASINVLEVASGNVMETSLETATPNVDSNMQGIIEWNPTFTDPGESEEKVAKAKDMKVCVAFDYMRVKIGDIPKVAALRPAIMALFDEEERKTSVVDATLGHENNGESNSEQKSKSKRQQKKLAKTRSRESLQHSDKAEVAGK